MFTLGEKIQIVLSTICVILLVVLLLKDDKDNRQKKLTHVEQPTTSSAQSHTTENTSDIDLDFWRPEPPKDDKHTQSDAESIKPKVLPEKVEEMSDPEPKKLPELIPDEEKEDKQETAPIEEKPPADYDRDKITADDFI